MAAYIPLSWNDPLFADNVNSAPANVTGTNTLSNVSITQDGLYASVFLNNGGNMDDVRISSREGVRIAGNGNMTISNSYIEAIGQNGDHADGIQTYSPGDSGSLTITNSTIVAHNDNATAGVFIADQYTGTFTFNDVVFQGGPFGLRMGNDATVDSFISMNNVYFVGPFLYDPIFLDERTAQIHITQWDNVRYATIENGVLVPGALIPPPWAVEGGTPVAGSVSINDVTISEGNSGTKLETFTVTRNGGTLAFDVNFATSDGIATVADSDYAANSGILHFAANVNTQTFSVTINGDTKIEPNETFNVSLSNPTNGATISDGQGVGTITNDDSSGGGTGVTLTGNNSGNTLTGGSGDDTIDGRGGHDWLYGGDGNDRLIGGTGNDDLFGGSGADTFDFNSIGDTPIGWGNRDLVHDFEVGVDHIDLHDIDAKSGVSGNQDFTFLGEGVFASTTTAGQLRFHYDAAADRTLVEGATNTQSGIDFQISLIGQHALTASDFLL